MPVEKYKSFELLKSTENEGQDYVIKVNNRSSKYVIMAPHGGGIEPGTTEIAKSIAGNVLSLYTFSGIKRTGNKDLHIKSELYDEPRALRLVNSSEVAIVIHGCEDNDKNVYIGGLNDQLMKKISDALNEAGFHVKPSVQSHLAGKHPNNICNACKTNKGVQIEISNGLRKAMFKRLDRTGRKERTGKFEVFVQTIQAVLENK